MHNDTRRSLNGTVGLWLVRHGQTDWNLQGRYQGHNDTPLNATGEAEAERAAQALNGQRLDAVISSDLQRARRTAEAIARQAGLEVQTDARLREMNLGAWEGMFFTDIEAEYPDLIDQRKREPVAFRAPGGESLCELDERVREVADEIAARYPGQEVALVSHGLALATLIAWANGEELGMAYRLIPDNASPVRIEWTTKEKEQGADECGKRG